MRLTISTLNRFRLIFALQFAGIGIFFPYAVLYLTSIGLSGPQVGLLLALLPLLSFLIQPVWGLVTDVYHVHRQALVIACFGVVVSLILFGSTTNFALLLLSTVLHALLRAPIGILSTSLALEYLAAEEPATGFGSIRLWGSLGFAIASFTIGAAFAGENIWWIIPAYALTNLLQGLLAMSVPDAEIHGQVRWQEGLSLVLRNRILFGFLLGSLLIGTTLGIVNNYLTVYLEEIHATGWIIGANLALSALVEAPLMGWVPHFVRRWGVRLLLVGGAAMLPIRWLLYYFIDEPLWVLPTQVLHSIAMMSLLVVGVLYVDRLLEPKWRASGQSLYFASLHGIGPSIGLYAAGLVYQDAGMDPVWLISAVVAFVGTLILAVSVQHQPAGELKREVVA